MYWKTICSPLPLQRTPSDVSQSSLLWMSLMSQDLGNWHSFPNQPSWQIQRPHEQYPWPGDVGQKGLHLKKTEYWAWPWESSTDWSQQYNALEDGMEIKIVPQECYWKVKERQTQSVDIADTDSNRQYKERQPREHERRSRLILFPPGTWKELSSLVLSCHWWISNASQRDEKHSGRQKHTNTHIQTRTFN